MKFSNFVVACLAVIAPAGGVFAADCSAAANVAISRNLTGSWRMLKVDVSSDSCVQQGCSGIVDVTILEHLPQSTDVNTYQFSFPYDINKGSRTVSFMNTRRFGADTADKPVLTASVSGVSCTPR
jgi:hypothetical protein